MLHLYYQEVITTNNEKATSQRGLEQEIYHYLL